MKKNNLSTHGFTLLELVISIGVIAVIGIAIVAILVSSLRNANKSNVTTLVRQNGDYALTQMTRNILPALNIQYPILPCPASSPPALDHIQFTSISGTPITYSCDSINKTINGPNGSLFDTNSVNVVAGTCAFYCTQASPSENPVIKVTFGLADTNTSNLAEQAATIQFQTSVNLRNIIQ